MKFHKIEGTGNDFIVVQSPSPLSSEKLRRLCDRHFGIGADGFIELRAQKPQAPTQKEQTWVWSFRNSDASNASMCGNAARALAAWFRLSFPTETEFQWQGTPGILKSRWIEDGLCESSWPVNESIARLPMALAAELGKIIPPEFHAKCWIVDSGVPHVVLSSARDWPAEVRAKVGPLVRFHSSLAPQGANVTFVSDSGAIVSFERGVDNETLACGSGALAAFLAKGATSLDLKFPGGSVRVDRRADGLWLRGPGRVVYAGEWNDV